MLTVSTCFNNTPHRVGLTFSCLVAVSKAVVLEMDIFHYCIQELHSSWISAIIVHVIFLGFCFFVFSFASQVEVRKQMQRDHPFCFSGWKTKHFSSKRLSICIYVCVYICVCMYVFFDGMQNIYFLITVFPLILFRYCNNTIQYMCALLLLHVCFIFIFILLFCFLHMNFST